MNNLLIEVIVLLTIGWATTALTLQRKRRHQQQAWKWWNAQHTLQAHQTAESIRDDLLQQTFAFRRYLETSVSNPPARETSARETSARETSAREPLTIETTSRSNLANTDTSETPWIDRFQGFHQSLEGLSNELSPPFISDSFPLALQFAVKSWAKKQQVKKQQAKYPEMSTQFKLPSDWPESSPQLNHDILSVVISLLNVLTQPAETHGSQHPQISVALKAHNKGKQGESDHNTLTVQFHNATTQNTQKKSNLVEIRHLKEIFHSLTTGKLEINNEGNTLISHMHWPSQKRM